VGVSAYDAAAAGFDRHRALPDGVPDAIRAAILAAFDAHAHPRLLDLGAGTGRIGRPFAAAGDDYVGVDLSLGMLREFTVRAGEDGRPPRLVRADGERLPFADATFDVVMLIQVVGAVRRWRRLLDEARRVLRATGALITGRTVAPAEGVDAQMKRRLAALLGEMSLTPDGNARDDVRRVLESAAHGNIHVFAAAWDAERTPGGFLERHRTGARFSALPPNVKDEALRRLAAWAEQRFGSLDAVFSERHMFELQIYKFQPEVGR
jgi:SAM-dependent methyltransferase